MTTIHIQIRTAAFNAADSREAVLALVKKAGVTDEKTRAAYIVGEMARHLMSKAALASGDNARLDAMESAFAQAELALAKASSAAKSGARRTKTEDKAYNAARAAWSRLIKVASVKNTGQGAGNSNAAKKTRAPRPTAGKSDDVVTPLSPVVPSAVNSIESIDYLAQQAVTMTAFLKKNGKASTVGMRNAVADFRKAIEAERNRLSQNDA